MTPRLAQTLLALVFFVLGGWCLVSPGSVMALTIRPDYHSSDPIVPILVAAFGAQALIAGLFAATAIFTRRTFMIYGIALLPFLAFDYHFYAVEPMLTDIGMLDVVGNVLMLFLCWIGWKKAEM